MKRKQRPGRPSPLRRFLENNRKPAGKYITRVRDLVAAEPNLRLVLLNRVSMRWQAKAGNLDDDRRRCLDELSGCNVIKQFDEVCSGRLGSHRTVLVKALAYAKRHGAALVTFSRDRLIRAKDFDGTNISDDATEAEYQTLAEMAQGVRLATILAPYKSGRGEQVKRGQKSKGKRGGRPKKERTLPGDVKRRRLEKKPLALKMKAEGGWSVRGAARELEVPYKTLHDWWQKG